MKKIFTIDENEKSRILEMHKIAVHQQYLNEQNKSTTLSMSQESSPAIEFINKLFKIGKYSSISFSSLSPDERQLERENEVKRAKIELRKYNMNQLTEMSKKSGVSVEAVKSLQSDLVKIAGVPLKFMDSSGQEKDFIDGNLGTNTVDAYLDYLLKVFSFKESKIKPTHTKPIEATPGTIKPIYQRK